MVTSVSYSWLEVRSLWCAMRCKSLLMSVRPLMRESSGDLIRPPDLAWSMVRPYSIFPPFSFLADVFLPLFFLSCLRIMLSTSRSECADWCIRSSLVWPRTSMPPLNARAATSPYRASSNWEMRFSLSSSMSMPPMSWPAALPQPFSRSRERLQAAMSPDRSGRMPPRSGPLDGGASRSSGRPGGFQGAGPAISCLLFPLCVLAVDLCLGI